ncbi:MAG: hypothetical protein HOY75_30855 [Streptomyces sp.]|nr:hypothetical protein [Streptomyces sp.]
MRELLLPACLAGAILCLAGHLPGPVRRWGPQVPALGGMALMAGGRALPGACAVGIACLWHAVRACVDRRGWTEVTDTAVMALLMALMTGAAGGAHAHMATGHAAAGPTVLALVVWVTARAGGFMFSRLSDAPLGTAGAPAARRARAFRESGATVMIISMAAMLV